MAGWGLAQANPSGISWHFFRDGAAALFGEAGLHTYAQHPELQIGPLSLAVAGGLSLVFGASAQAVAQILGTLVLPLIAWLLRGIGGRTADGWRRDVPVWLVAAIGAPAWGVLAVRWAHLDDVLALGCIAAVVRLLAEPAVVRASTQGWLTGLLLAAATASKPWAVIAVPLLLLLPGARLRIASGVTVVAGSLAAWLPFVLADSGTLSALSPPVAIDPSSMLWLAGVHAEVVPSWVRTAQLLLGPAVAALLVLTGRWRFTLLGGVAVRLALDPQNIAYYAAAVVVAAAVAELAGTRTTRRGWPRPPWRTLIAAVVWWQPFVLDYPHRFTEATGLALWWFQNPTAVAIVHAVWIGGVLGEAFWTPLNPRRGRPQDALSP